ncbi:protein aurora borealis [Esox lucius]|uniref:Protein aurora borealis n=1 Tax=Esox lucius TaxID=8010 RepID=A0A3P8ZCE3_ESOLU|nr:protein aurora borealis [Esox lucius]XP_010885006.2 protein aurora borealis [Esox lucius]XP_010885007.2 protein aurora borealis [Esox lucius]XP_010885008.2 protein aurora borealis [Esox lucius]XP_019898061.2 protein aurora borealis [Esox lucius]
MGDMLPELQITPETPGRPAVRNPFESPNDYHRLHEPVVPSPSVFKFSKASTTPAKFKWDIDEMASLLPVHIDAEDIHRQSMYLSQTRMDSDIEAKHQNAIEQFFTKGAIVPSPWSGQSSKTKSTPMHFGKSSMSPLILEEPLPTKKITVGCQTLLSLPGAFDLEKILGEYYRYEEVRGQDQQEQVQENLSSSSLRRKLFLDGHWSGSESSSPPSPDGVREDEDHPVAGAESRFLSPIISSPPHCPPSALTPSTGQFSSSPIRGRHRDYSLGSVTSPLFPERSSPAGFTSPALSPIGQHSIHTPRPGERKKLSFVTPEGVPLESDLNSRTESPYVDGCSPIRSCSPLQNQANSYVKPRLGARCWASPPLVSPILNPSLQDQENIHPFLTLPAMDLGSCSPSPVCCVSTTGRGPLGLEERGPAMGRALLDSVKMEEGEDEEKEEDEEEVDIPVEEEGGVGPAGVRLTSSRMGESVMTVEASHMFVSLLAEGSIIPYDNSMQVDSGYNTYAGTATASLIDATSSESQSKESFDTAQHGPEEAFQHTSRHAKTKTVFPQHH